MCSYLGSYPAALARSLICMLSEPGEIVFDPFSGRGTTLLETRLLGRRALASDLNPIAVALTTAKNTSVGIDDVIHRLRGLREAYDPVLYLAEAATQPDEVQLIYDIHTLAQLCYLKRHLLASSEDEDKFLVGVILGIMHGSSRQDGTSGYLSISMPNTFSMSPGYVRRFVEQNKLQRVPRNAFDLAEKKLSRVFQNYTKLNDHGIVSATDIRDLTSCSDFSDHHGCVDLIVTSPPYLDIVNYGKQNWIRNWFLDGHKEYGSVDALDDDLLLRDWLSFMDASIEQMKCMLRPGGVIAMVIGDVVRTGGAISLAREFIQRVIHQDAFEYVGCLNDRIQTEVKTTRIWKETKGRATSIDRIVILSDETPRFKHQRLASALFNDSSVEIPSITASQLRKEAKVFAHSAQ